MPYLVPAEQEVTDHRTQPISAKKENLDTVRIVKELDIKNLLF